MADDDPAGREMGYPGEEYAQMFKPYEDDEEDVEEKEAGLSRTLLLMRL